MGRLPPRFIQATLVLACCALLAACVTGRPRPATSLAPAPWDQRMTALQRAVAWQMDGRAAVALGSEGWQASLNWRQDGSSSELHLAGPFGVGAQVLKLSADGLSVNGAPPTDATVNELEDKLGFDLPLADLRYWLLGVPDPQSAVDLTRNEQDRAAQLVQAGWTVVYDRYAPVGGDLLPAHMVLSREAVRVRIVADHWSGL